MNLQQTGYFNTLVKLGVVMKNDAKLAGLPPLSASQIGKVESVFARGGRMPAWLQWGIPVGGVGGGGVVANKLLGKKQSPEIPSADPEEMLYQPGYGVNYE